MNFEELVSDQLMWSLKTFGPGGRQMGLIEHIGKEIDEVMGCLDTQKDPLEEWVDVMILAIEGAWRSGHTPAEIALAFRRKFIKNSHQRTWPDWRTKSEDEPIEHVREGEE